MPDIEADPNRRPRWPGNEPISRRRFIFSVGLAGMSSTLLGCGGGQTSVYARPRLDLLIAGGDVIDGTGKGEVRADVGIRDGRIISVGDLQGAETGKLIDASGLKVVPGFIDIHSHVDLELFRDRRAESKVRQGVTTEVSGMDGDSPAPLGGPDLERRLKSFEESYGFPCPYRSVDEFLSALARNGSAQNMVFFAGLGTIRENVVGLDDRPASPDEMERMKREVIHAIEQGCWGVSTGLEYIPGSFASTQELWELVSVVPERYRLYATHMRNEDDRLLEAIEEAVTIARNSGGRLQVSHLKAQNRSNWPKQERALQILEDALDTGVDVHADRYPYIAFSTGLTNLFPLWSRDGGREEFLRRLADPTALSRMRPEVEKKVDGLGSWDAVMISSVKSDLHKAFQGLTVQQIISEAGADPFEFVVDLLLGENGSVGMVGFGMDEAGTEMVLAWKNSMVASDGGAYSPSHSTSTPHPRTYGTFPRAISLYQRERKIVNLPDMIRKMTSLPAMKLGLRDRGVIAEGKAADIVVFDYESISDKATFLNPHQFPEGIPVVIVNGIPVVDQNTQTDQYPGDVLRSG